MAKNYKEFLESDGVERLAEVEITASQTMKPAKLPDNLKAWYKKFKKTIETKSSMKGAIIIYSEYDGELFIEEDPREQSRLLQDKKMKVVREAEAIPADVQSKEKAPTWDALRTKNAMEGLILGRHNDTRQSVSLNNATQFAMGISVEMEHVPDGLPFELAYEIATRITLDHLAEIPDYYTRLAQMEAQARKEFNIPDSEDKWKINEAVEVDTKRYVRSVGKEPKGAGAWAFKFKANRWDNTYVKDARTGHEFTMFTQGTMSYGDALKQAKAYMSKEGLSYVELQEEVVSERFSDLLKD